ncbi:MULTISPECIES: lipoprotein signal peptidase [Hymenobacter]|uniref:Lipoprotein signal peptidase n=1 Tax=Hymenobacter jejuensis TaxID=2502781 RepID=A0A5B7ZYI7_9BACT|nr:MULTISPECIES: lipoprotein signal peptidase [Hymenobacter]MBC6991758.1 lipoprotein signal peptidase [Hymenobacter sp. BT491]QDA60078.1 lipoprotein signal peptidase [Hymenobacter jejuensis]
MKYWKYYLLALLVIVIDQVSKWAVHTYMLPGMPGEIPVFGNWFKLHYTLNPGMAFGVELPPPYGKILLTGFRLLAMFGISYYIFKLWQRKASNGLIWCVALILGGAIGNLIDSIFYGIIYNNAPFGAPTPWFHGQVIDMLYADIYEGFLPANWPLIGGTHLSLWPIFNIADSAIFVGVVLILLNQNRFFNHEHANDAHLTEHNNEAPSIESVQQA